MIEIDDKKIYFPLKYEPRDTQIQALNFIKSQISNRKRFLELNIGMGVGKSYLVMLFANWYRNYVNTDSGVKIDILTNSKVLQNQYIKDFEFISNYKGKSNYYCQPFDCQCDTGKELCRILKRPCDSCPYDAAKNKWLNSEIGLTNFHLFNTLAIFQQDIFKRRGGNVLIIDECQGFESIFSDYLSSKISPNILKRCGLGLKEIETLDDRYISKIKDLDKYLEFLERKLIPIFEEKIGQFESNIGTSSSKKKIELSGFIQNIESKLLSFKHLFESYKNNPDNIVLEVFINKSDKIYSGIELITQHIFVHEYLNNFIFSHYDHVILMSATILDSKMFGFINGLDENLTCYYDMPSPFALKNRPIYYLKIGKMNWTSKEETFKKQIPWIKKILAKYKNNKGIIHTTNYEIAEWVKENIMDERLLFHESEDKNDIFEKHLTSTEPTVLVSPSMIEGISLDDELARFQIILKINYPNLTSAKIKARQKMKPEWYNWRACVSTVQATGRGVRSDEDYCDTFILDSNFSDLLKYNSHILPRYFTDAIKTLKI
jgi:Rad3-related DNA helicase